MVCFGMQLRWASGDGAVTVFGGVFARPDGGDFVARIRAMALSGEARARAAHWGVDGATLDSWLAELRDGELDTHTVVLDSALLERSLREDGGQRPVGELPPVLVVNVGPFDDGDAFARHVDELLRVRREVRLLASNLKHFLFVRRFVDRWPSAVREVCGSPGLAERLADALASTGVAVRPIAAAPAPGVLAVTLGGDDSFSEVVLVVPARALLVVADLYYGAAAVDAAWPPALRCFFALTKLPGGLPAYRRVAITDAALHAGAVRDLFASHPGLRCICYAHGAGVERDVDVEACVLRQWDAVHGGT